eukprot:7382665-Prymnesium_polylepis.1
MCWRLVPSSGSAEHALGRAELHTPHRREAESTYVSPHPRGAGPSTTCKDESLLALHDATGVNVTARKTSCAGLSWRNRVPAQVSSWISENVAINSGLLDWPAGTNKMGWEVLASIVTYWRCSSPPVSVKHSEPSYRAMWVRIKVVVPPVTSSTELSASSKALARVWKIEQSMRRVVPPLAKPA